jgi:hypothetical protein
MVLGGWVWVFGGELCGIRGVHVDYFQNMGDLLSFRVVALPCASYIDLFMLNYAPAVLLPSASIEDYFRLEGAGLLNMGSGYVTTPEYRVRLGQRDLSIMIYYAEISDKNVLLSNYMAITPLPIPVPVSVLF